MSELEIIRHVRIDGISMFFDTVEYRTPHFHPEWELIWITDGELSVRCAQREAVCGQGELCLFAPRQVHAFARLSRPVTFLCLQIAPQVFSYAFPEMNALMPDRFQIGSALSPETRGETYRLFRGLMAEYLRGGSCYQLRCLARCAELLSLLFTCVPMHRLSADELANAERRNQRLERFLRYVDENYNQRITLEAFALTEHCSVSYLSRFLKRNLNQSFQDYVNTIRFHCACRLIAEGRMRLIDVSEESGFSDYRYFSNCFKKMCGMTPEEYRRTRPESKGQPTKRSLHSVERFYTPQETLRLLEHL